MKYVGIQSQIWRNNRNTVLLLCLFPVILLGMVLLVIMGIDFFGYFCVKDNACAMTPKGGTLHWPIIWHYFLKVLPYTLAVTGIWFFIAYLANTAIIRKATHARPLERKENLRVYNIVENLCIAGGIEMPQINIVEDSGLNAFASGIDIQSFTITLTTGLIEKLNDAELSAVVGHELTHIKNRDTRLMVVCIVFVGIFSTIQFISMKVLVSMFQSPRRHSGRNRGGVVPVVLFICVFLLVWSTIAYFFSWLTRLAISRSREYVADAGACELCGDTLALASALKKISDDPGLCFVRREDVAQLYIIHPDEEFDNDMKLTGWVAKANTIFCTHPDTPDRIKVLEQF